MNEYCFFAPFYDALTEDVDYEGWADYLLSLFSVFGAKHEQILDLACGSGSLSLALSDRGVDVIGVDGSADMLAIAREKAEDEGKNILFLCQDMRQLDLYGTVNGAVCMLDSLSHIVHTGDLREIFRRLGLFIEPGGLLVFDVNTPYKHKEVLGNNAFVLEKPDFMCVWQNHLLADRCQVSMQLDFFLKNGENYERYTDTVSERAYALNTWKKLLCQAGFDLLGVYGERTTKSPETTEQRWVLVARNRAIGQKNG